LYAEDTLLYINRCAKRNGKEEKERKLDVKHGWLAYR
jgi:hypothetical protein